MKISEYPLPPGDRDLEALVGLRVKAFVTGRIGTIDRILWDERFPVTIIRWDEGDESSFYENACDCEIVGD